MSYLLDGRLTIHDDLKHAEIYFEREPHEISAEYSFGGRGMELSELLVFNGKLYSCDDRTGIVYEVLREDANTPRVVPWVILVDGDGRNTSKGNLPEKFNQSLNQFKKKTCIFKVLNVNGWQLKIVKCISEV